MQKLSPTAPVPTHAALVPDAAGPQASPVATPAGVSPEADAASPASATTAMPVAPHLAMGQRHRHDTYDALRALGALGLETTREGGVLLVRCQASTLALVGPVLRAPRDLQNLWLAGISAQTIFQLPLVRSLMRRADSERVLNAATPVARFLSWGFWTTMQISEYRSAPEAYASGCAALAAAHLGCNALNIQGQTRDLILMCTYTAAREATHLLAGPTPDVVKARP